jgi:hypothetical protein
MMAYPLKNLLVVRRFAHKVNIEFGLRCHCRSVCDVCAVMKNFVQLPRVDPNMRRSAVNVSAVFESFDNCEWSIGMGTSEGEGMLISP